MIRLATSKDTLAIWQIRTQAILTSCVTDYSAEIASKWAHSPMPQGFDMILLKLKALVFVQDGKLLGFGFIDVETGCLEALFVAPESHGCGVGKAIARELELQAIAAGLKSLSLSSALNALCFYQSLGYLAKSQTTWQHPLGFELACVPMSKTL
ncbi:MULTISPECIES: GNAT family N-acetyltransferase [unclassified Shewanella]|uniref:GNAT family N-acetyltransferase n=1 Tax=unclassified Shewanella TaxID=196818 RepID=UPI001BC371FA|nr:MULTISPECIES: GNAT family N-acetyltransferase [unclassified Shewanella]GIU05716.1 N-acetyltransferase [Shewanella sp. MBTL60-112-B1]GIU25899.1 N-acetyltransferase [Shewanella sp. MBTL60-112-B2]